MDKALHFSSESGEWQTPLPIFRTLDSEFHFTLDAAADDDNHLCERYLTTSENGLEADWLEETVWLNPPYGRDVGKWVKKCWTAAIEGATVVALLPARTDTRWFHDFCWRAEEIRFVKGRLHFTDSMTGDVLDAAPFPSMVVIWRPILGRQGPCLSRNPRFSQISPDGVVF